MLEASANGQSFNVTVPAGKEIVCPFRAILCPKVVFFFYQDRLGTHTHTGKVEERDACVRWSAGVAEGQMFQVAVPVLPAQPVQATLVNPSAVS